MDMNNVEAGEPTSAVSIFGQEPASNEFPVLKAFQEYINAEQAKARKRMLGLSIFFGILLTIVVGVFTIIVAGIINRNQALQDRLLEAAFRQQSASPSVAVAPQPGTDMRPVLDRIDQLTSAIARETRPAAQPASSVAAELKPVLESIERLTSAVARPAAAPAAPASPAPAVNEKTLKLQKQLERERAQLAAERKKLQEAQRQAEVERNRRRLYPEYYAKQDALHAQVKAAAAPATPPAAVRKPSAPALPAAGQLEALQPVGYFDKNAAEEDAELAALIALAKKRRAASEAARKQAEADEAEAAKRKTEASAAKRKAEADKAEAAKTKAAAQAAQARSEAEAAKAAERKAAAQAERQRLEAELAEARRATAEADKRKAEAAKLKAEREFPPPPPTETINVGGKESSVPWIIQRLAD